MHLDDKLKNVNLNGVCDAITTGVDIIKNNVCQVSQ